MNAADRGRARRRRRAALAALVLLAAAGCANPLADMSKLATRGYLAADLLPADRAVGSWRLDGKARTLRERDFRAGLGEWAASRLRQWDLGASAGATYRLGDTGRTLSLEVYDLARPHGAFDVYGLLRDAALGRENKLPVEPGAAGAEAAAGGAPRARVTKVGAQGLLFDLPAGEEPAPLLPPEARRASGGARVLVFWVERFVVKAAERGGTAEGAEAALLAFAEAVSAKVKKPQELAEVYVLQIPGELANSERCERPAALGREELPWAVLARWRGRSGSGELFISVFDTAKAAGYAFERLRRAAAGALAPDYADGMFSGQLPGGRPLACFRRGLAVAGLLGAADAEERLAALEEIRKRCAGEVPTPALEAPAGGAR